MLEWYVTAVEPTDPRLTRDTRALENLMKLMNAKEEWSIARGWIITYGVLDREGLLS